MIVDAFLYAGELEMLELRLRTLAAVVDVFVPVVCALTHQGELTDWSAWQWPRGQGIPAPHGPYTVYSDLLPDGERGGVGTRYYQRIERLHRDGVVKAVRAVTSNPTALVMVSDVDEIPDPDCVAELESLLDLSEHVSGRHWLTLEQRFHSTALDLLHPQQPWLGTCVSRLPHLRPQAMRDARGDASQCEQVSEGGWHLSWFGDDETRARKLDTFSHAELRGRFDPRAARSSRTHSNGEPLEQLTLAEIAVLSWPAPLVDGTFVPPASWWAPLTVATR